MLKETKETTTADNNTSLFGRENYIWMIAGIVVIAIGYLMMAGGKSPDPKVFNADEVYSARRITVAPILILAGFIIEIVGIMKKPKNNA